jgi:uncharacterized protein
MRAVFVDTAYWIAQFDSRDQLHAKALEIETQLTTIKLVTSEQVLGEFLTYFGKGGEQTRREASGTVREVMKNSDTQIVWQTQILFESGLALYEARLDKGYSLTDCVSMVVMRQLGIQEVLTHDRHFSQEGFTILL